MPDFDRARERMVCTQIAQRGIRDERILKAFRSVPREKFVQPGFEEFAYEDGALPIEANQTISQPYIVALMVEAAQIKSTDRVLEVGTGSGYAVAILSQLAARVYGIERHATLLVAAKRRLEELGYDNVELREGDGTRGWPEAQPFDAILVAASGPEIPQTLLSQLTIGGRLIIPVGRHRFRQTLCRVTRRGEIEYEQDDLGGVAFVPLIGEHGWAEDGRGSTTKRRQSAPRVQSLPEMIAQKAEPLPDIDDDAFARWIDRYADRRVVLLGEATHGTSEFYRARAAFTRRLVKEHGFTIVAAEADWPDAAAVDRYIRHRPAPDRADTEPPFQRFPTWMWRNLEFQQLVDWLREHNADRDPATQVGFYGLDLYNLSASIAAVLDYLDKIDPEAAAVARQRYGCLTPWQREPSTYGRAVLTSGYQKCERAVIEVCRALLQKRLDYAKHGGESFLDAAQNARLITTAERYYRVMYYGGVESWNLRDQHMFETLTHVLAARGPDSKAVVWAHNSHIGDARFTEMGAVREELNIGQLSRERCGAECALIGFSTHTGTVAAADDWDGPMKVKQVRPSVKESYERLCHDSGIECFALDLVRDAQLHQMLGESRLERFIGVLYLPETELLSHYAQASLSKQFDALVWFDETRAVTPPGAQPPRPGAPDTYPFSL